MRHRIAALGGSWDVHAAAAGGTSVTARIPLTSMVLSEHQPVQPVSAA
jgi:signal transduction histidine kinase